MAGYTHYDIKDYKDPNTYAYTYFIGEEVSEVSNLDPGLHSIEIPQGEYIKFTTERGKMPDIVIDTWQEIWAMDVSDTLGAKRLFGADFEVYDERAVDPENSMVDIYIGIE